MPTSDDRIIGQTDGAIA